MKITCWTPLFARLAQRALVSARWCVPGFSQNVFIYHKPGEQDDHRSSVDIADALPGEFGQCPVWYGMSDGDPSSFSNLTLVLHGLGQPMRSTVLKVEPQVS